MAMTPRTLAVSILVCRIVVVLSLAAALACAFEAPDAYIAPFLFLKLALPVELLWNVSMLLYDAVKVFTFLEPLPAQRDVLPILVIIDWVLMCVMLGAGSSSMAVVVFLQFDTRACSGGSSSGLHPRACSPRRGAAAGLTLWAWFFSLAVAVLMLWMQASRAAGQQ